MSWRDSLVKVSLGGRVMVGATFRGVPFLVESSELSGGRRTVRHEYPMRDVPFVEDMGLRARSFPIEGHIVGDDYLADRDSLIEALDAAGVGELVHPYFGIKRVIVSGYRVRETSADGGMVRFSIDFDETPERSPSPNTAGVSASLVAASGASAISAAGAGFLAAYGTVGAAYNSVSSAIRSATLEINKVLSTISSQTQRYALLKRRLNTLRDSADALLSSPSSILDSFSEILEDVGSIIGLRKVYDFDPGDRPPTTTATRTTERDNFDATQRLVQRLAVINAAMLAPAEEFDSYEAAKAERDALADLIDEQSESADDDTYTALMQLRADLVKTVPGDDDLPHLISYTPLATTPSLVLAYALYGSLDMELDLVARNGVKHPGFMTGGVALEVLSSA